MSALISVPQSTRRHDLDWLRVLAFGALIFYHIGMFYVTWGWHVKSDHASSFLEPAMSLLNPWRLALLFFISGVALRFAVDARGFKALLPERSARLFVPLAFGMLVLVVPQAYFELCYKGEFRGNIVDFYPRYLGIGEGFSIITPTWNHLWYVAYVLVYTLLLAGLAPLLKTVERHFGDTVTGWLARRPATILLIAAPFVFYSLVLNPLFPTTHALIDDWATHANYLTVLLVGWFVARNETFWSAVDRVLPVAGAIALALGVAIIVARLNLAELRRMEGFWPVIGVLRTVYAWAVIVTLLGLARRFLWWSSPALNYMSEAVFPWYILHQTIIVVVGYAMIGSGLPVWGEAAIIVVATVGGCLILHEYFIRRVWWLRPLFGLKRTSKGRRAGAAGAMA